MNGKGFDLVVKLLVIVAVGAVGAITVRLLDSVEKLNELSGRVDRLEVKMDALMRAKE